MTVEQAIFTSVQNGSRAGYQLAATSPGISKPEAKELARWGPAHDSLLPAQQRWGAINFHTTDAGRVCISRTIAAGAEYSGRGGFRIVSHSFIVDQPTFDRFARNPFRLLQAIISCRAIEDYESIPKDLAPIRLVGRASLVDGPSLTAEDGFSPTLLVAAVTALLTEKRVGFVVGDLRPDVFLRTVWSLIPLQFRSQLTFTTGLRHSPRRPYQIMVLPDDGVAKRQLIRRQAIFPFNIRKQVKKSDLRMNPWARNLLQSLENQDVDELTEMLQSASYVPPCDSFDQFLERWLAAAT